VSQAHHGATPAGYGAPFVKPDEISKGHMYAFVIDSNFRTNFRYTQHSDVLFRYSVTSHTGDWRQGRSTQFGWSVGHPLIAETVHGQKDGPLPIGEASFCQIDQPNVLLTGLKQAEDGNGIILRLTETQGKKTTVTVTLLHVTIKDAKRNNVVEELRGDLSFTEHEIRVHLKPFGITTCRVDVLSE
jgi:alpha-mannosidase